MKHTRVDWCPGNGTRYDCTITKFLDSDGRAVLLTWLRKGGSGGTAFLTHTWSTVSLGYLCEKMDVNEADGAALLGLLKQHGVDVYMPEGYDEKGCMVALCGVNE